MAKLLTLFFALFMATAASAQTVVTRFDSPQFTMVLERRDDGRMTLDYSGAVTIQTEELMSNFLNNYTEIDRISMHSPGGDLLEINGPGRIIRERGITFVVEEGKVCVSACAFLALFSPDIELDGLLAFHLPYRPVFSRDETLYEVSQSMVERTIRISRQMFQNDWMLFFYLIITEKSAADSSTYVVFADIDELNKFKMTSKDEFMDRPDEDPYIIEMTNQDISNYISTSRE